MNVQRKPLRRNYICQEEQPWEGDVLFKGDSKGPTAGTSWTHFRKRGKVTVAGVW